LCDKLSCPAGDLEILHSEYSIAHRPMMDEYEAERVREEAYAAAMGVQRNPAGSSSSSHAPVRHTLTAMTAPPFESDFDPNNAMALRVIAMAQSLGIDPSSEFYLIPIAVHALDCPPEWVRAQGPTASDADDDGFDVEPSSGADSVSGGGDRYERVEGLAWFGDLVRSERERFQRTNEANSPWVKLRDKLTPKPTHPSASPFPPQHAAAGSLSAASPADAAGSNVGGSGAGRTYYYNFKTLRSSATLPPAKNDFVAAPSARGGPAAASATSGAAGSSSRSPAELDVMRFTSWFWEGGNRSRKRYVRIRFVSILQLLSHA
jgi:hypothetical protein